MAKKLSRAKESTATTGTGNVTVAGAVAPNLSLVDAGAVNGDILELVIEDSNGNWEYGYYPYSAGVLTRSGSVIASSNSNSPINLSGTATVFSDFLAESVLGNKAISPSQITANTNDWDPADSTSGSKIGSVVRFSTDASRNFTGLKAGAPGEIRGFHNVGSFDGVFQDESSSTASTAANRFTFGTDIVVKPKETLYLIYDNTSSRWRPFGGNALRKSGVTAGSYGSATAIPAVTVDAQGRISAISTNTVTVPKAADQQVFTASGTWTKPSGFSSKAMAMIQCWGGGGGGSRSASLGNVIGGGGGAYKERWILLSSLGSTETVTVGAGGIGRTGSSGAGGNGGNTTFGAWVTAYAGQGGDNAGLGGFGGGHFSIGGNLSSRYATPSNDASDMFTGADAKNSSASPAAPGRAVYGGGGGGSQGTGYDIGGVSQYGGNGANTSASAPAAGAQPGGGGASANVANADAGNGGAGKCIVTVFDGA